MVLSDQLLTYYEYANRDDRNFVGWQNSKEGLHGFMSFCSLLGIYDKDVEQHSILGIPPHPQLMKYKEKLESDFKKRVAKKSNSFFTSNPLNY